MSKPRLLIPISLQFSVRYLLRTGLLDQISSFCEPVVLLGWQDPELEKELREKAEVHSMVKSTWGADYERTRSLLNVWHQKRLASPSTPIRERRANLDRPFRARVRRRLRNAVRGAIVRFPDMVRSLHRKEADLMWTDTNAPEVAKRLTALRADAIFSLTPFLQDEELAMRICSRAGLPSMAAILSFDNLTTRSWIPFTFDSYLLWNRHNLAQLHRGYPETMDRDVQVVGSPQFDFYWDPRCIREERDWRRSTGLPQGRPVILFGGGYYTCAPHEPRFLQQIDEAIESGEIPDRPVILFRRHPVDPLGRWEPVLRQAKHIVHDDPWRLGSKVLGHTNVQQEDIAKLASTLYHSRVHVNVASTMMVDGSIFDRPQVGPAYDDSPGGKYHTAALECYRQEHFLPIYESGGLSIARNRRELAQAVRSAFRSPEEKRVGRARIVSEICTYNDGRCTGRVARAIESFLGKAAESEVSAAPASGSR